MEIKVIGPRDRVAGTGTVVNTTSKSEGWSREFSPFYLGPIPLYGGRTAKRMENAWQFAKVYPHMLEPDGKVSDAYRAWAQQGWAKSAADRYPMGKGAKPAFVLWDGEQLAYVESRLRVYFPLYRDAVRATPAFAKLQKLAKEGPLTLWDFDGYDHEAQGMSPRQVCLNPSRSMGHAFVLKAMLLYGPDVKFEDIEDVTPVAPVTTQLSMF
jgi:hypothetical protein